jgi:inorganic pyrophosphatase/exopolyphosphatase
MPEIIVTAGEKYNDIDALACAVAYSNLLNLKGLKSKVILTGPLNESVSKSVKSFNFAYETSLNGNPANYEYVLVDISDHTNVSNFVIVENVIEVFDHRWGFEQFWLDKPKAKTIIDKVGSCATLIWEKYKELNLQKKIDTTSANLLYTAIISNTLNMKAQITSERDLAAVKELKQHIDLPLNWDEIYFNEVTQAFLLNPVEAIHNDTKVGPINGVDFYIMQVELWNSQEFINTHKELILDLLNNATCANSFLTSPSISEGINYIFSLNSEVKKLLTSRIGAVFDGNMGKTEKLWLRKEIIRELSK